MRTERRGTKGDSDNFCENRLPFYRSAVNAPLTIDGRNLRGFTVRSVKTDLLSCETTKTEVKTRMIYFIRYGSRRIVKIGHCTDHPRIRMGILQTGTPERLTLLGMAPGGLKEEKEWHRRFAHLRVRGEWFQWTPELRAAAKPHLHERFSRTARRICEENSLTPEPLTRRGGLSVSAQEVAQSVREMFR
jgi:hypothetical protein